MQTKLTLRLDEAIIAFAKHYAEDTHQSISKLVENYFVGLSKMKKPKTSIQELPPLVTTLRGSLAGTKVSEKDYKKYLEEKYR